MKKSVEILGLPVISITEGRELGMSKTLLIDAKKGTVAAITIEDEDWYRGVKLIPYESVIAIGDDAVTVTNSENILTLDDAGDYEQLLDDNIRIIGTKAITKSGSIQGKISELYIGDDGKIEKCEITAPDGTTSEVTADQISIFGKQVTVIDPSSEKKNEPVAAPAPAAAAPAKEAPAPEAPAKEAVAAKEPAAPKAEVKPDLPKAAAEKPAAKPAPAPAAPSYATTTYKIKPGDNLTKIAKEFNTTVEELVKLNGIANPNLIIAGADLTVPTPDGKPSAEALAAQEEAIAKAKAALAAAQAKEAAEKAAADFAAKKETLASAAAKEEAKVETKVEEQKGLFSGLFGKK